MVKKERKSLLGIRLISIVLIIVALAQLVALIFNLSAFIEGGIDRNIVAFILSVLMVIFLVVVAVMLYRLKEWARVIVIFLLFVFFANSLATAILYGFGVFKNLFFNLSSASSWYILLVNYLGIILSAIFAFYLSLNKKIRGVFK